MYKMHLETRVWLVLSSALCDLESVPPCLQGRSLLSDNWGDFGLDDGSGSSELRHVPRDLIPTHTDSYKRTERHRDVSTPDYVYPPIPMLLHISSSGLSMSRGRAAFP